VVAHVKTENDALYREIELHHTGGGVYPLELTPELHENSSVFVFVVAVDRSGHEGGLGEVRDPLLVKRKRWFQR
jgi:hypothetical protein